MADIKVPTLGESITTATVAKWLKKEGEAVKADEPIVELETDKVTVEVNAPAAGAIEKITAKEGSEVEVGALLGSIKEGAAGKIAATDPAKPMANRASDAQPNTGPGSAASEGKTATPTRSSVATAMPSAQKIISEKGLDAANIQGSGKDGRILKEDAQNAASGSQQQGAPRKAQGGEERVKMTKLRQRIAQRLKESQNTAAILTTFNEVDMTAISELRKKYQDNFVEKHGTKIGFMSFFVKACVAALKEIPAVNASIEGDEIVYHKYYHVGVAVGTKTGLVVPNLRDADQKSFAEIEKEIAGLGKKAREGKISVEDLSGGTFSITNGGIYGSLMSTPIINPPQTAILGMHAIKDRPMAVNGQVVIRPMMYLALSYDHRLIDGSEAVTFLVRVKEALEDPARLLIEA